MCSARLALTMRKVQTVEYSSRNASAVHVRRVHRENLETTLSKSYRIKLRVGKIDTSYRDVLSTSRLDRARGVGRPERGRGGSVGVGVGDRRGRRAVAAASAASARPGARGGRGGGEAFGGGLGGGGGGVGVVAGARGVAAASAASAKWSSRASGGRRGSQQPSDAQLPETCDVRCESLSIFFAGRVDQRSRSLMCWNSPRPSKEGPILS